MTSPRLRNPIGVTYADDLSQVRMPTRPRAPTETTPVVQVGTDDPSVRNAFEQYVLDPAELGAMAAPPRDTQGFLPIPGLEDMPGADLPHAGISGNIPPEVGGLVTGRGGEATREAIAGAPGAAWRAFDEYINQPIGAAVLSDLGTRSLHGFNLAEAVPWPTPLAADPELGAPLAPWQEGWREQYAEQPLAARLSAEIAPWLVAPAASSLRGTISTATAGKPAVVRGAGELARAALLPIRAEEIVGEAALGTLGRLGVGAARAVPKIPGATQAVAEAPFEILGRLGETLMGKVKQVHKWASQTDTTRPSRRMAQEAPDPEADIAPWRTPKNVSGSESGRNWADKPLEELKAEKADRIRIVEGAPEVPYSQQLPTKAGRDLWASRINTKSDNLGRFLTREEIASLKPSEADIVSAERASASGERTYFGGKPYSELPKPQKAQVDANQKEYTALWNDLNTDRWGDPIGIGSYRNWEYSVAHLENLIRDAGRSGETVFDPLTRQNVPIRALQGDEAWLNAVKRDYGQRDANKLPKTVDEAIPVVQARIDEVKQYWDEALTPDVRQRINNYEREVIRLQDPEIDVIDPGPGIRNAFEADGQRLFEQVDRPGVGAYRARLEQVVDEWIDFTRPTGTNKAIVPRWKAGKFKGEELKISADLLQGKKRNRLPGMRAAVMRYLDDQLTRQIDSGEKGGVVEIPEWMGVMGGEDSLHGLANAAYKETFTPGIHTPEELAVQAVNERGQVPDLNLINDNIQRMGGTELYTNVDDVVRAANASNGGVFQSPTTRGTGIEVINSQWVLGRPIGASERARWQAYDFLENKWYVDPKTGNPAKFSGIEAARTALNADLLARNSEALDMRYEIVAREIDKVDVEVAEVSAILKSDDFDGVKLREAIKDNPELLDNWVKTIFVVTRNQETNKFMIGLSDEVGAYTSPTSYANKVPVFDPDQFPDLAFYHNHIRSQVFDSEQAAWTAATTDTQNFIGDGVRPTPTGTQGAQAINAQTTAEPQIERVIREGMRDWLKTRDAVTAVEESERAAKEIVYQFEERGGVGQFMSKPGSNEPYQYKNEKAARNFLTSLAIEQSEQGTRWRPYAGIDNGKPMTETEAIQKTGDTVADEIGARNNESDHTPGETHTISGLTDQRVVSPPVSGPAIANSISWPHTAIDGQLHIETSAIMRLGDTDYVVTDVPNWGIQPYARIGLDAERAWVPIEGIRLDPNTGQADLARSRFIDMAQQEGAWDDIDDTLEGGIYFGMGNTDIETISRRLTAGLEDAQGEHWALEDWQGLNEWFGTPHATGFSKASAARATETPPIQEDIGMRARTVSMDPPSGLVVDPDATALKKLLDSDPDLEVYTKNVSRENKAGGPRKKGVQVRVRSKEGVALDPKVAKYTTRNTFGPTFANMEEALAWADEVQYGHRSRAPGYVPPEDPTDLLSVTKVPEPDEVPKLETPAKKTTKKLHKVKKVEADAADAGGDGGGRYVKELAGDMADDDNPVAKLAKIVQHYDPLVARASEKVHAARQQIGAEIMGTIESTELAKILHGSNGGRETGIYTQEAKDIASNMMGKLRVRQISDPLSEEYQSELIAKLLENGNDPDLALTASPLVQFSRKDVEDLYKGVHEWLRGKGRGRPLTGANAMLSLDQIMRGDLPYASNLRILDDIFDLKKKYGVSLEESAVAYMNKSGSTASRLWENLVDFLSMPKAIVSSMDFSAPLRQAVILGPTHPVEFFRNIPTGLRLLLHPTKSRKYADTVDDYVTGRSGDREYANFLQEHGLYIAERNAGLSGREESFMTSMFERIDSLKDDMNWAKKALGYALAVPNQVVLRSERGFTGYLNLVRADVTDTILNNWIKAGKLHKDIDGGLRYGQGVTRRDVQELTLFINRITGRGGLGPMENIPGAAKFLNATFFSPRFVSARVTAPLSVLTPRGMAYKNFNFFGKQGRVPIGPKVTLDDFNVLFPRTVRAQAIRDLSGFVATGSTILYLLSLQDNVTVELDPRSPDFGKGRIGPLRFDFWGGHQTVVRYAAQFISGQAKNSDDKVLDRHRSNIATRAVQSKLSPFAGFVNDVTTGTTFTGDVMSLEPGSIKKQAWQRLGPLVAQDINDAFRDSFGLGLLATTIAPLGVSVTVYNGLNEIGLNIAKKLRSPSGKTWMDEAKDRLRNEVKDVNVTDMSQLAIDARVAIKNTDEYRAAQDEAYFKASAKRPEGAELVYQNLGEIREASRATYDSIEKAMNGQADAEGIINTNYATDSQMRTMVKGALGDLGAMSRLLEESVDFEEILGRREEQAWDVIANLYWSLEPETLDSGELDFRGQKIARLGLQHEVNSTHGDDAWVGRGPVTTMTTDEGRPIHVWDYIQGEFEDGTRVPAEFTHLGKRIDPVKYPKASEFLERMRNAEAIYEQLWWGVPDDVLSRLEGSLDKPGTPASNYYQYLQAGPEAQKVLKNAKGVSEAIEIVGLIREKNRLDIQPVFEGQTLEQMSMNWGFGLSSAKTIPGEVTQQNIIQAWSPANVPTIPTVSDTPGLSDLLAPIGSGR